MNNKKLRRYLSIALTPKSIGILLIFSFTVTVLAFAVAYNEHKQILVLSQKYDEAIVKINNCEEVLDAMVKQMENSTYSEVTVIPEQEETTTGEEITTDPEESVTANTGDDVSTTKGESGTAKPETTQKETEKSTTTTKAQNTSGPYFVTQSGKKYHIASCSYLNKSKIPISADRIKSGGYSPCSRCIK